MRTHDLNYGTFVPLGRRVLLRKCLNADADDGVGGIILPDAIKGDTRFCELIRVANDCRIFKKDMCRSPKQHGVTLRMPVSFHNDFTNLDGYYEYWLAKEDLVEPVIWSD